MNVLELLIGIVLVFLGYNWHAQSNSRKIQETKDAKRIKDIIKRNETSTPADLFDSLNNKYS